MSKRSTFYIIIHNPCAYAHPLLTIYSSFTQVEWSSEPIEIWLQLFVAFLPLLLLPLLRYLIFSSSFHLVVLCLLSKNLSSWITVFCCLVNELESRAKQHPKKFTTLVHFPLKKKRWIRIPFVFRITWYIFFSSTNTQS